MDENTKHIVASNLTAAFYAGYVRSTEYKDAPALDQSVKMTYTGFLHWLAEQERMSSEYYSESEDQDDIANKLSETKCTVDKDNKEKLKL